MNDILDLLKSADFPDQEFIAVLEKDRNLRRDLVLHFVQSPDRDTALTLLEKLRELRDKNDAAITTDTLMLACYIVGLHQQITDCVVIWNAKTTDFDTFCAVDIQLAVFAGIVETIAYLETQSSDEAKEALEYILKCNEAGDFEDLAAYYDKRKLPWFI